MRKTPQLLQRSVAALASLALIWPSSAFAATSLYVNEEEYTSAAQGSGTEGGTWNWAGPDGDLTLDNYQNAWGTFYAQGGDLNVIVIGDNKFYAIMNDTYDGNLTLTGQGDDASLTISTEGLVDGTDGEINSGGDLTISNLDIDLQNGAISSAGAMTIEDSSIDGEHDGYSIHVNYNSLASGGLGEYDDTVFQVTNSHIHVVNTDDSELMLIDGGGTAIYINHSLESEDGTVQDQLSALFDDFMQKYGDSDLNIDQEAFARDYPEIAAKYEIPSKFINIDGYVSKIFLPEDIYVALMATDEFQEIIQPMSRIVFEGVEGDIKIIPLVDKNFGYSVSVAGEDDTVRESLIEPVEEPEPEPETEPSKEEPTPEPDPTPGEEEITPEPEPEPEVVNPVEEAPAPDKPAPAAPAPAGPQLPKTDDATSSAPVAAMAAGGVSALLAGSVLLRRRPQE